MKLNQRSNNRQSTSSLLFLLVFLLSLSLVASAEWAQWRLRDGGNGHFYEVISVPEGISWPNANVAAHRVNRFSHLATITSQEENDFVTRLLQPFRGDCLPENGCLPGSGWLGGIQTTGAEGSADGWRWVTEEAFVFTNWCCDEPNDYGKDLGVDEIFVEIGASTGHWNDCCFPLIDVVRALFVVESTITAESEVKIDIKPGDDHNHVIPHQNNKLTIAILTTDKFNAKEVNANTVRFGPGEARPVRYKLNGNGVDDNDDDDNKSYIDKAQRVRRRINDVDYDGDWDMVLTFKTRRTGIACGDTEATLTGKTFDGVLITGTDAIKTVRCHPK